MSPVVRFDRDEQFWLDWERQWMLYGTVYAINHPEPRVVPFDALTVHEGPCEAAAPAALDSKGVNKIDSERLTDVLQGIENTRTGGRYPHLGPLDKMHKIAAEIAAEYERLGREG